MTKYEYKTIACTAVLELEAKSFEQQFASAVSGYGDYINSASQGGWEFYAMEHIILRKLMGSYVDDPYEDIPVLMMVFRRPLPDK